jgi:transcriptional regulator with XRE-family HTH domain
MTGNDLLEWRQRLQMTTRQAADVLGCSRTSYMRWESGQQDIPHYIALACAAIHAGLAPAGTVPDNQ